MFYFIPSWYPNGRTWYDNTQIWYYRSMASYFDDSISQLRMFYANQEKCQLLLLNYMPNLRYYTHRYDLLEIPTWSAFDEMQGIEEVSQKMLDFLNLNWPKGIEFIYSPFLVIARLQGRLYAKLEFGEEGQLTWIDRFEEEQFTHRLVFDDRGFLSSILYFREGREYYQDYLGLDGQWQLREYLLEGDRHVEIAPVARARFLHTQYASIEEVILEKVHFHLKKAQEGTLIVAADKRHRSIVQQVRGSHRFILSFFTNRMELRADDQELQDWLEDADLIIADSIKATDALAGLTMSPVQHQPLYDTRLSLGKSQRIKELIVYFLIDHISNETLLQALSSLVGVMETNRHIHLELITYETNTQVREERSDLIKEFMKEQGKPYFRLEEDQQEMFEIIGETAEQSRVNISVIHSENDIIQALDTARLVIDLSEEPNLYTQIAAISAGIPQINLSKTEFVEHKRNGYLLSDMSQLDQALLYYLDGLKNWNESLIYSIRKIADYTSGVLVENMKDGKEQ